MELNIPAIKGIGDSADLSRRPLARQERRDGDIGNIGIYDVDFEPLPAREPDRAGRHGLTYIDHLTHNVHRGRMERMGGVLRAPVQLPRGPLLRHRRPSSPG
ncbi:MAG: hypothetical protein MZW92_36890 [Comamonadaceae bacterium]|nr:hypothetical protein [Comamonadaceae bacterium]